ncbi:MAG TPA: ribose-5-phosphate isomerase RpiA [Thermomicrobiales bacterium]|nr:ribose-5-phosphate isomerase RpiA [Thermomicrobiales bacterium]
MNDADRLAALAEAATALVEDGMTVGLGSGSTAEAFVRALGARVQQGLTIQGIPTSRRTEHAAREAGIPLTTLSDSQMVDFGIDGADEIDPRLNLIKGRGGALLYEKLVAEACNRWVIVAAAEKLVDRLGTRIALPVEIIPFGWETTQARVEALGFAAPLRVARDGVPLITDGNHFILDCATGPIDDPKTLGDTLKCISGVIDHGLFVGLAAAALVCEPDGTVREIIPA